MSTYIEPSFTTFVGLRLACTNSKFLNNFFHFYNWAAGYLCSDRNVKLRQAIWKYVFTLVLTGNLSEFINSCFYTYDWEIYN